MFEKRTDENFILLQWKLLLPGPGPGTLRSSLLSRFGDPSCICSPLQPGLSAGAGTPSLCFLRAQAWYSRAPHPCDFVFPSLGLEGSGGAGRPAVLTKKARGASHYRTDRCSLPAGMLGDFLPPRPASSGCCGNDDTAPHFQRKRLSSGSFHTPSLPPSRVVIVRAQAFGRTDVTLREALERRERYMCNPV